MAATDPMDAAIDEARLLFSTEVFLSNTLSLAEDLASAKYTLLSFSDKSRNEVKQKTLLIPAVGDAYRELLGTRQLLAAERQKLNDLETRLVCSASPRFLSVEEAHSKGGTNAVSSSKLTNEDVLEELIVNDGDATPRSTSAPTPKVGAKRSSGHSRERPDGANAQDAGQAAVVVLNAEDIKRVREAESLLEEDREQLVRLARETNVMENQLEVGRANVEEMSKQVQSLQLKYDEACARIVAVKNERSLYTTLRLEWEGRKDIWDEAQRERRRLFLLNRSELQALAERALSEVQKSLDKSRAELEEKKRSHEVELAVYQIAYKEQQAAGEELKDAIAFLRRHQRELELMAKRQEIERIRRSSLRGILMSSLRTSSDVAETLLPQLTAEHLQEVEEESRMVNVLGTRISVMEARRKVIAAELLRFVEMNNDVTSRKCALERVRDLLMEEIIVDEEDVHDCDAYT